MKLEEMFKKIFLLSLFVSFFTGDLLASPFGFVLMTSLFNETRRKRCKEYFYCLEKNLAHGLIDEIHILYDTSRDRPSRNMVLNYLKNKKVRITYTEGRSTYDFCFNLVNTLYSNRNIILANADICFDKTLSLLKYYCLEDRFLAITRWDLTNGKNVFLDHDYSQDVWIFKTPMKIFGSNIKLGIPYCDNMIAYQAWKSGFEVINPSLEVKCIHVHESDLKHYSEDLKYYSDTFARLHCFGARVPFTTLNVKIYPQLIPFRIGTFHF